MVRDWRRHPSDRRKDTLHLHPEATAEMGLPPSVKVADRSPMPVSDMVLLPKHYGRFKIEPIHFIEENSLSPLQGKVVKYVCRYDAKNGLEDLHKARRCLDMLIKKVAGDPDWWRHPGAGKEATP